MSQNNGTQFYTDAVISPHCVSITWIPRPVSPQSKNSSPRCAAAVVEIDPNPPITVCRWLTRIASHRHTRSQVSDCISDLVQHLEGPNVTLHPCAGRPRLLFTSVPFQTVTPQMIRMSPNEKSTVF